MTKRRGADEAGDSLVEIVLALVIIGVVIGAFVATFSTGATASSTHRKIVTADVVLRNYAEQIKSDDPRLSPGRELLDCVPPARPAGRVRGFRRYSLAHVPAEGGARHRPALGVGAGWKYPLDERRGEIAVGDVSRGVDAEHAYAASAARH